MSKREDLYVGYILLPTGHKKFVRGVVAGLVVAVAGVGGVIASQQRDPGDGVWDTGEEREWEGVLVEEPYPMLVDSEGRAHLLVSTMKAGVQRGVVGMDGQGAIVSGFSIEREGRRMIEMVRIERAGDGAVRGGMNFGGELIELTGEVLDSKCYLGAMKPGDGKGHRACATLCIEGGIPAMLFVDGADGSRETYLLTDANGESARDVVLGYVGESVLIKGKLGMIADLDVVAIESIERRRP